MTGAPAKRTAVAEADKAGRVFVTVVLAGAIAFGMLLRFERLAARELSADEAATWAAAIAPDLAGVISEQVRLNPGKLALEEVALHFWIELFGDSEFALRSLSAALGSLAIVLVFGAAKELAALGAEHSASHVFDSETQAWAAESIAAVTALLFAVNLVTIKYSREARMYPMLLVTTLAQVWFLLRAERRGGFWNHFGLALFSALALATHFTAALLLAGEGIWLGFAALARVRQGGGFAGSVAWQRVVAIGCGVAILAPFLPANLRSSAAALSRGALSWVSRPRFWEPVALFNKATGSLGFPVLLLLAALGIAKGWRSLRAAIEFSLIWMWSPVLLLLAFSYLLTPLLVERYALSCFVPFFFLAALGICSLGDLSMRVGAVAMAVAVALGHIYAYQRRPHGAEWREATAIALAKTHGREGVAVAPAYAANVVRYYSPPSGRDTVMAADSASAARAAVLILGDQRAEAGIGARFPVVIARVRGVEVRTRSGSTSNRAFLFGNSQAL